MGAGLASTVDAERLLGTALDSGPRLPLLVALRERRLAGALDDPRYTEGIDAVADLLGAALAERAVLRRDLDVPGRGRARCQAQERGARKKKTLAQKKTLPMFSK